MKYLNIIAVSLFSFSAIASEPVWIGPAQGSEWGAICPAPCFVKTLELSKVPAKATAEIAAAGWFELRVNGEKPMTPRRVAQIQNHEKWHEKAYPYAGYRPSGRPDYAMPGRTLSVAGDEVTLGPDEFYACGDNSPSSYDSRYWGPVPAKCLVGIAGGVFWPFATHRWGPIE
jgi:type IV secretory pathway protease TraF